MTSEQLFVLVILAIVVIVVAAIQISKGRHRIKRVLLSLLKTIPRAWQRKAPGVEGPLAQLDPRALTAEESEAELDRLQRLIEDRKQIARNADLPHHLWGLYKNLLRYTHTESLDPSVQDGRWYDVKILQVKTQSGLHEIEFELKDAKYKFVNDEENQNWSDRTKYFSLFLYDDSDRCLVEVPMKLKVDRWGRNYSVLSDGPKAFLPGDWVSDIINVKLKHQSLRNREIRAQKHQDRLSEIEDLKDRFGILD